LGDAVCWGFNGNGQIGDGTTDNRFVPTLVMWPEEDLDEDGVGDSSDNCPDVPNSDQSNSDRERRANGEQLPGDDLTWPNGDSHGDSCDDDDDNDGMSDADESSGVRCWGTPTNPSKLDSDGDHLSDPWECGYLSDPNDPQSRNLGERGGPDADGDHVPDVWEMRGYGSSPASTDSDSDGCLDFVEIASVDGDRSVDDPDRLAVARRALKVWGPNVDQDYVFDIDKNGSVGDPDRLFVARAALQPGLPKSCP
jgi:hypothetical protein